MLYIFTSVLCWLDSGRESPHSRSAVADTAIRHFQEQQALESNQKTPTKKSTLIIHGVSEVRSFLNFLLSQTLLMDVWMKLSCTFC